MAGGQRNESIALTGEKRVAANHKGANLILTGSTTKAYEI